MKKDDEKLIIDYINGNDIDNYNIEDLEKDYDFMKSVIDYTNDKNMYDLCDETLKTSYDFVIFLYEKFPDDKKFLCKVIDYCLEKGKLKGIKKEELIIIMYNLTKGVISDNNLYTIKYSLLASSIYEPNLVDLEIIKKEDCIPSNFGLGFTVILEKYKKSKIITDFFATRLAQNIFLGTHHFEAYLHQKYKDEENANKQKINNLLINYLMNFDEYLSGYISCNINLLDDIKKGVNYILNASTWENYDKQLDFMRLELAERISEKYSNYIPLTSYSLLSYALKPYNIDYYHIEDDDFSEMLFAKLNSKETNMLKGFVSKIKSLFNIYDIDVLKGLDADLLGTPNFINISEKKII